MTDFDFPRDMSGMRIHFVGIKGTGMAALVEICFHRGALITGCDVAEKFYTDQILEKIGINPQLISENNLSEFADKPAERPQIVVYSSAYSMEKIPDLQEAVRQNIPCILYSDALGALSKNPFSVGICGVHGKTTTTGITGTLLSGLNLPMQTLAGSVITSFDNSCTISCGLSETSGKNTYFVAETCEYQRHFMHFHPEIIVLTSVESDHQDYYPTFQDIQNAFVDYIGLLPQGGTLIYCADDAGASETASIALKNRTDIIAIPYGTNASGDFALSFGKVESGVQHFSLAGFDVDFALKVPGRHTVLDAAAAIAASFALVEHERGTVAASDIESVRQKLLCFAGAKRRSELVAEGFFKGNPVTVIDDYGHHPTAIRTTLAGYRDFYPDHVLIVDFMSHTYSRTAALIDEFASSFDSADSIILHKIYGSAREVYTGGINGRTLYEKAAAKYGNAEYFEEILEAVPYVEELLSSPLPAGKKGYLLVTMGAGDNWKLGRTIADKLEKLEKIS